MKTVQEKIAYLRGLLEGGNAYGSEPNAKAVWEQLLNILDDLGRSVSVLGNGLDELTEYVEAVDGDLMDLEDEIYGEEDDDHYVEIECPSCGELVRFEEEFLYDDDVEITCPECGEVVYQGSEFEELDELEEDMDEL
ncbi:MAG: AraC family transcriptional regulator [Firmicutes bacterium]|nr:AraC family transcriptional regulator [Bacillota bacterium]